jgi:hypothetical protein
MTYDDIHPTFRNALGVHEVFRRVGFTPEDIFVHRNPDGEMHVAVVQGEKRFAVTVGFVPHETEEAWADDWNALTYAVIEKRVSERDFRRCLEECGLLGASVPFLMAMRAKGIVPAYKSGSTN